MVAATIVEHHHQQQERIHATAGSGAAKLINRQASNSWNFANRISKICVKFIVIAADDEESGVRTEECRIREFCGWIRKMHKLHNREQREFQFWCAASIVVFICAGISTVMVLLFQYIGYWTILIKSHYDTENLKILSTENLKAKSWSILLVGQNNWKLVDVAALLLLHRWLLLFYEKPVRLATNNFGALYKKKVSYWKIVWTAATWQWEEEWNIFFGVW